MAQPKPAQPEFTAAHHVMLNGLALIDSLIMSPDPRFDSAVQALAEALPHAVPTSARTKALITTTEAVLQTADGRATGAMTWTATMMDVRATLATLFYWRTASALDALRASLATEEAAP
jgi:uncharacterized membrane protein